MLIMLNSLGEGIQTKLIFIYLFVCLAIFSLL